MALLIVLLVILACFSFVIFVGAPYLPTLSNQIPIAFDLLSLKPGQTVLELGSGDGRVLIAAAQKGLNAVGYEINPLLFIYSWLRTIKYRQRVRIIWGSYWQKDWPPAEAIFVFLLDKYMNKMDKKIVQYKHKPVKLVSFAFKVPGKQPKANKQGLYLYEYK
jgi:hypothetical protein